MPCKAVGMEEAEEEEAAAKMLKDPLLLPCCE